MANDDRKNIYKITNARTIEFYKGHFLSLELIVSVINKNVMEAAGKCLIHIGNGIVSGPCRLVDIDGDIRYINIYRNTHSNYVGTLTNIGGTGKWLNNFNTCTYIVDKIEFVTETETKEGVC